MLKDDAATCLAEWSSRGPRYTSYPPATEFGPIADDVIVRELATIARLQERVSLYLHIPFCKSLCWYCGCNVIPTRDETRGIGYVDDLSTELALVSGLTGRSPVTEIALGGGSPNFLAPRTLRALIKAVETYFPIVENARRSIELDPRATTASQIDALADLGFTAVSVGVQDFAAPVQDAINRHQSILQTRWLVEYARKRSFEDVNIDIVYGLPRQSELSFSMTLDAVLAMEPDRVALFGYAHLPSKLPHQALVERAGRVLDRYERASLLLVAIERFTAAGYVFSGSTTSRVPGHVSHVQPPTSEWYARSRATPSESPMRRSASVLRRSRRPVVSTGRTTRNSHRGRTPSRGSECLPNADSCSTTMTSCEPR